MILNDSRPTKFCPDCRQELPVGDFTKNKRSRDGLAFYCGPCARARVLQSRRERLGPHRTRSGQGPRDLAPGTKWCSQCDEVKALDDFPRNRSQRSGRGSYCKPCHNRLVRENRELHGGSRNYHLRRRYGITAEHFDRMFAEQGGLCAICAEAPAEHVDHDHATNRVRALLCFNCNGALGQFRDRADLMLKAAAYVNRDPDVSITALVSGVPSIYIGDFTDPRPDDEPRIA